MWEVPYGRHSKERLWPISSNQCKRRVNLSLRKENPHQEHQSAEALKKTLPDPAGQCPAWSLGLPHPYKESQMNLIINSLLKLGICKHDLDYQFIRASMLVILLFFGFSERDLLVNLQHAIRDGQRVVAVQRVS